MRKSEDARDMGGMRDERRGSALLIVLGMLSFMVVSAVGFSMYMRASRAPSSYLRRNVAARYLVKAALAKAIGELEGDVNRDTNWGPNGRFYGIYDDPYPGIVVGDTSVNPSDRMQSNNGDYWAGRVFMPFGSVARDETVPTLTLEALAYLPPAIINDVRYFSRLTRTAKWRRLPYDAGHYAYCAVNVSDFFDINRLRADVPRDSGANRITLSSLCTTTFQGEPAYAGNLDDVLDKGQTIPFTSLADFNFAAGVGGSQFAPFMDSVFGSRSGQFHPVNSLFITDTWFPPKETTAGSTANYEPSRPFAIYDASSFVNILEKLNPANGGSKADFYLCNLGIGLACLYDYLDSDSKPISLALPTTEAVPMIIGVSSPAGLSPSFGEIDRPDPVKVQGITGTAMDSEGNSVPVNTIVADRTLTLFGIKSFGRTVRVPFVAVNPFKRLATTRSPQKTYSARGLMRVWLAPNGMGCRPSDVNLNLYPSSDLWNQSRASANNGVATFVSQPQPLPFGTDVKKTDEAFFSWALTFSDLDVDMPLYYKVHEEMNQDETKKNLPQYRAIVPDYKNLAKDDYKSLGDIYSKPNYKKIALQPLALNGAVEGALEKIKVKFETEKPYPEGVTVFNPAEITQTYQLYVSLWIQVMDGSQVVDMVPACAKDDVEYLGAGKEVTLGVWADRLGDGSPLLSFKGQTPITFEDIESKMAETPSFSDWSALYAVDPRYNFAPESWFALNSPTVTDAEWRGKVLPILGKNGRDHDIFMFVSDQEYLQSIGELQFLPWMEDVFYDMGKFSAGVYGPTFGLDGASKPFSDRIPGALDDNFLKSKMENGGLFWKTYSAYPVGGDGKNDSRNPYKMRTSTGNTSGDNFLTLAFARGNEFKLNPFSCDDRVIGAALIGTPFDYYVASTNSNQTQSGGRRNNLVADMTLADMMNKYSFGNSSLANLSKDELVDIAGEIKDTFEDSANNGNTDWLSVWDDNLKWQENDVTKNQVNDDNKTFMAPDITLSEPLHGVDRKYLYSFWRDCFDNRQQLFLIFVRAEPTSVGGGGIGRVSSQLGGRAVALVWRDPAAPNTGTTRPLRSGVTMTQRNQTTCPPHRTRVLFYHQFD